MRERSYTLFSHTHVVRTHTLSRQVLESDPVLYSLHEICSFDGVEDDEDWSSTDEEEKGTDEDGAGTNDVISNDTTVSSLLTRLRAAEALVKRLTLGETQLKRGTEDAGYFGGYSHYGIHEEMLKDRPRTEGYRDAMQLSDLRDKIVLDVGCGTGILSLFAARSGAKHVVGIDRSDIIDEARRIVANNGYEKRVTLLKGKLEDIVLPSSISPDGTVDVIVSEWMGYMLLFESMLPTVLVARDRWLREGGLLFPNRATVSACVLSDRELYESKMNYWTDVYGFDMSNMRAHILAEPLVDVVDPDGVASDHCRFVDLDLNVVKDKELDIHDATFRVTINRDCDELHAVCLWFDVSWPDKRAKPLTTSPEAEPTHWKQTVLFFERPLRDVKKGTVLDGKCTLRRGKRNEREYTARLASLRLDGADAGLRDLSYHMAA